MFKYSIIKEIDFEIKNEIIDEIFLNISKKINKKQNGFLNIIFINQYEIKKLNNDYRKKDSVTDVLSFHYFEDFSLLKDEDIAGEIVFCLEKIKSQAIEFGLGEEKEFYKLLIHSVLHILGYDHENDFDYEIMQKLENEIWNEIFEKK